MRHCQIVYVLRESVIEIFQPNIQITVKLVDEFILLKFKIKFMRLK